MGILQNIYNLLSPERKKLAGSNYPAKKDPLHLQINRREYRIDASLERWKSAVLAAENPETPRREFLYRIYDRVMEDSFLLTQVRTARFNVQMADFRVSRNGEEDEDLTKLFNTPWFFDYLEIAVDTELYGHSLIESEIGNDGLIEKITLIPRSHVRPESGEVVLSLGDQRGVPIEAIADNFHLIAMGRSDDLGLLKSLSKDVIRKNYNLTDWGRRNERFGMPFIIDKTSTRDKKELDKKEQMLRNFGANAYAIIDDQDEIELMEPSSNSGGGHKTFVDFNSYVDSLIAFAVNGQTGTTEEQAYVGTAEVHERKENKYARARMKRIQYHINEVLLPFLVERGYPLMDCQFEFSSLMDREEEEEESEMLEVQQSKKKSKPQ